MIDWFEVSWCAVKLLTKSHWRQLESQKIGKKKKREKKGGGGGRGAILTFGQHQNDSAFRQRCHLAFAVPLTVVCKSHHCLVHIGVSEVTSQLTVSINKKCDRQGYSECRELFSTSGRQVSCRSNRFTRGSDSIGLAYLWKQKWRERR